MYGESVAERTLDVGGADEFDDMDTTGVINLMKLTGRQEAAQLAEELRSVVKSTEELSSKAKRLLTEMRQLREKHSLP